MTLIGRMLGACALAAMALPGAAAAKVELKLSTYLPPQHQINVALQAWADDLRARSNGELDIALFPAGQMGPPPRQLDMVRTGVADLAFVYTALTPGRFPRTDVLSLPFLMADEAGTPVSTADASWLATTMEADLAPDTPGVRFLFRITTTAGAFFMREAVIRAPDDLKGLRVRPTSAAVAEMIGAMGASPTTVSPTELADAIGKGVVDGAVFNFEGGKVFGLAQAVREVSRIGFSTGNFGLAMNQNVYDDLPDDLKALIDETTGPETARRVGALYDEAEIVGEAFMREAGVAVHDPTPEELALFRAALEPVAAAQLEALAEKEVDGAALVGRIKDLRARF